MAVSLSPDSRLIAERFQIADLQHDILGSGGMGTVYLGQDLQTGERVAIKMLKPEFVQFNADVVARFQREGDLLLKLNHPNVVKRIASLEQDGNYYLVMEYVPGGSLAELLGKQGKLSLRHALKIALELSDALTRIHHMGITHRDLKPANVLLAEDGTPRLTDFGIAHLESGAHVTQTGLLMGTIDYLSPEACQGLRLDGRADIWAFGVILFEMLTGRRPFQGDNVAAILTNILYQSTPDVLQLRSDMPVALVDLLYRMLEKETQQRIPSMRLVGAELELLLQANAGAGLSTANSTGPALALPVAPISTPSAHRRRHNLPSQTTAFVGREPELAELARLLDDPQVRLITILGPGGMGKTRLGLETARRCLESGDLTYNDGVFFIPLATVREPEAIPTILADAIGYHIDRLTDAKTQLLGYLGDKRMLLLFDNFEHLLPGAGLVTEILQAAADVKVLATTRERLNVQGENLLHLQGMDFPDWETPADAQRYSAVQLFLQSARRVRPDFELLETDLKYISRICRLVGGLPLGILLAAAWLEMLSPQEISAEISGAAGRSEENLEYDDSGHPDAGYHAGHGLEFLSTDQRDLPERHRSIKAVCDYSWNLLSDEEKETFRSLGVFHGGFTRQAAQEVVGANLRSLMALVNKSLLHRSPSTGRYDIHELLHQYALEKLAASPDGGAAARDRHSAYYAGQLERWLVRIKGSEQHLARAEMEVEYRNLWLAWEWAARCGHFDELKRGLDGLAWFCIITVRFDDGEKLTGMACVATAPVEYNLVDGPHGDAQVLLLRALALSWRAYFNFAELSLDWDYLGEAMELLTDMEQQGVDVLREKAQVMFFLARTRDFHGDSRGSIPVARESLALFEKLVARGETIYRFDCGYALQALARTYHDVCDFKEAGRLMEKSVALRRATGDHAGLGNALHELGQLAWVQGHLDESIDILNQALDLLQTYSSPYEVAFSRLRLGEAHARRGDFATGIEMAGKGINDLVDLGMPEFAMGSWVLVGELEMHQGHVDQVRHFLEFEETHNWLRGFSAFVRGMLELYENQPERAVDALQQGIEIFVGIGHRESEAWALSVLALAERQLGKQELACQHLRRACQNILDTGAYFAISYFLPAAVLLLAEKADADKEHLTDHLANKDHLGGRLQLAAELWAWAQRLGFVANSVWFELLTARPVRQLISRLSPEQQEAARLRSLSREMGTPQAESILAELIGALSEE